MKNSPPFADGVNVCGYLRGETGLGSAARGYIAALEILGIPLALTDVSQLVPGLPGRAAEIGQTTPDNPYRVNLIAVPAQDHDAIARHVGEAYLRDHYNIGVWVWELPEFPREFHRLFAAYDEIWTGSSFVANALSRVSPIPVIPVVPPVSALNGDRERGRARIGVTDETIFLFVFDFWGIAERKNALGVIDAFNRAFRPSEGARLVIKSANGATDPLYLARMRERANSEAITLFDGYWETAAIHDLMAACDVYVSLHRAEGTGLTMMEAMSLGKPVIATGWSGNMDFMFPGNSLLVELDLVPLARDFGLYRAGQLWAEPSIAHAAELMRRCVEDPAAAHRVGQAATKHIADHFSVSAVASVVAMRLDTIEEAHQDRGALPLAATDSRHAAHEAREHPEAPFSPPLTRAEFLNLQGQWEGIDERANHYVLAATDVGEIWTDIHDTTIGHSLRSTGSNEPGEGAFLRRLLRPGMNVVDVGANIGYFTRMMAEAVGPEGRVVALEPEPRNFALLRKNLDHAHVQTVTALQLAAGAARERRKLAVEPARHGGHHLLGANAQTGVGSEPTEAVEVDILSLDELLEPETPVDFVKIDIEGFDHLAVQGLQRTLRDHDPVIVVEFYPEAIRRAGADPMGVLRTYREMGLSISHELAPDQPLNKSDAQFVQDVESGRLYGYTQAHTNLVLRTMHRKASALTLEYVTDGEGNRLLPESSWRPVMQRSIDAFYEGQIDEGAAACRALLNAVGLPEHIRELTYQNQHWYARPLRELVPGASWQWLDAPVPKGWTALDPSPVVHEGRLSVVMRRTPDQDALVTSPFPRGPAHPMPDVEIISVLEAADDDRRRTELRPYFEDGAPRIAAVLRGPEAGDAARAAVLWLSVDGAIQTWELEPRYGDYRQGWSPLLTPDGPRFIAWWEPTEVFRLDAESGEFVRATSRMAPHLAERFRGGSQGVPVPGGYLFLVNETVTLNNGEVVTFSRFVRIDDGFQITDVSPQFFLEERGQEVACGLARQGDRLIAGFTASGSRALLASIDLAAVVATLLPVAAPGPPREPAS